jgi:hypothetical protein
MDLVSPGHVNSFTARRCIQRQPALAPFAPVRPLTLGRTASEHIAFLNGCDAPLNRSTTSCHAGYEAAASCTHARTDSKLIFPTFHSFSIHISMLAISRM